MLPLFLDINRVLRTHRSLILTALIVATELTAASAAETGSPSAVKPRDYTSRAPRFRKTM